MSTYAAIVRKGGRFGGGDAPRQPAL